MIPYFISASMAQGEYVSSGVPDSRSESCLYRFLAVKPSPSYLLSESQFLINKMGRTLIPTSLIIGRMK